ncbi:hypothetical protein [Halosimplex pelagicum]|uniref:PQQ-binding-like beta-propeller repeat protein n=1 Tax=Halosimplex pelagicum TaxID=869886 RepID=A0A7D5P5Q6_9EURY|nr:hypothetical protein [Halosimplex pelagicum]QLH81537.1 hypothetical protein HZS54_07825 [Halosimplex pelagicum]
MGTDSDHCIDVLGSATVGTGQSTLVVPGVITETARLPDGLVLALKSTGTGASEPSPCLDDRSPLLLEVTDDCTPGWEIESFPDDASVADISHRGGRLIVETDSDRFVELDPETGDRRRSWRRDEFVFDGRVVEFDRPVESFERSDGRWVVQTARRLYWFDENGSQSAEWSIDDLDEPERWSGLFPKSYRTSDGRTLLVVQADSRSTLSSTMLFGFDETGEQTWRKRANRSWGFHPEEDGGFSVTTPLRRNTYGTVEVDIDTGEFVRVVNGPDDEVAQFLDR